MSPRTPGTTEFIVQLSRSARDCEVAPHESIVQALARIGVHVQTSCQEGICGTCLTTVLGGQPDHRDQILSAQERAAGDVMCLCVSRSNSPVLILDL